MRAPCHALALAVCAILASFVVAIPTADSTSTTSPVTCTGSPTNSLAIASSISSTTVSASKKKTKSKTNASTFDVTLDAGTTSATVTTPSSATIAALTTTATTTLTGTEVSVDASTTTSTTSVAMTAPSGQTTASSGQLTESSSQATTATPTTTTTDSATDTSVILPNTSTVCPNNGPYTATFDELPANTPVPSDYNCAYDWSHLVTVDSLTAYNISPSSGSMVAQSTDPYNAGFGLFQIGNYMSGFSFACVANYYNSGVRPWHCTIAVRIIDRQLGEISTIGPFTFAPDSDAIANGTIIEMTRVSPSPLLSWQGDEFLVYVTSGLESVHILLDDIVHS